MPSSTLWSTPHTASNMRGSIAKKTPKASPKGKGKKEEEAVPPYMLEKMKVTTQCFVDADILAKKNTCLFRGEFHTPEGKKVPMVALPDTFQQLGHPLVLITSV